MKALRHRGLNLVELLVGLAILAMTLFAVVPGVVDWVRDLSVRNAAESMRSGLERARVEALRRNTQIGFWLVVDDNKALSSQCRNSDSGPSWVVAGADPGGRCDAEPSLTEAPRLVDRWSAAEGAAGVKVETLTVLGDPGDRVLFNSLGQVTAGDQQVQRIDISHPDGGRPLRLLIEGGGAVRLCDPAAGEKDPRRC